MGYVFHKSYKHGRKFVNCLERAKLWAAGCDYISTWTCELRQHLYDRWYAIGHGKFLPCNLISPGITNKNENTIVTAEHMIVEKKQVLDPEKIMKKLCYCIQARTRKLKNPEDQEEILWFTCKVMPAVGKNWKLYNATGKVESSYSIV